MDFKRISGDENAGKASFIWKEGIIYRYTNLWNGYFCEYMELVAFRERENVVRYRHVGHAIRRRSFAYYVDF